MSTSFGAARLGSTEGSARLLIYRMRGKYRELLQEEIAHTVADRRDPRRTRVDAGSAGQAVIPSR